MQTVAESGETPVTQFAGDNGVSSRTRSVAFGLAVAANIASHVVTHALLPAWKLPMAPPNGLILAQEKEVFQSAAVAALTDRIKIPMWIHLARENTPMLATPRSTCCKPGGRISLAHGVALRRRDGVLPNAVGPQLSVGTSVRGTCSIFTEQR